MSDPAPREASTPSLRAAPSLITVSFIVVVGFGIIVPLPPFHAKSMPAAPWQGGPVVVPAILLALGAGPRTVQDAQP